MSKTRRNALTKNFSGKFGDQMVYRNRDGVTTLGLMPKKNNNPPTESQLSTRRKFKMASRWAKQVLQDTEVLAEYIALAKGLKTPYIMAMTNYLRPPEIVQIIAMEYTGAVGDKINVIATDDFKVTSVKMNLSDPSGNLIEQGNCQEDLASDCWVYTATTAVLDLTGVVITATASDSFFSFLIAIISIWVHMEIRLAELNVEIVNLKQDLMVHKSDNRKDFETLRLDIHTDIREILRRMDDVYLKRKE